MRSMQQQLGILGTISAFAYRRRETKKNLCRGGRLQDLPNTDLQPAVRHLKKKIATIIEFVPNCLQHVSGDGYSGGSDSYLQFRDTCGRRRNINLILDVNPQKEITWGFHLENEVARRVVKTATIIFNNPVLKLCKYMESTEGFKLDVAQEYDL